MRICFFPSDPDGPGSYRCLFPMEQLAKNGHYARLPPHELDKEKGLVQFNVSIGPNQLMPDADVYVLQMPQQNIYTHLAYWARIHGRVVVGEVDDDFINLAPDHPAYEGTQRFKDFNRFWMLKTFALCNALTVTTPHLQRMYKQINTDVRVIPNYLNWEMWKNVTPQYELDRKRIRIGWMGSAMYRPRDVALLERIVLPFLRDHPEVDFVLAGDNRGIRGRFPQDRLIYIDQKPFRARGKSMADGSVQALDGLPSITANMDIGLIPLVPSDFNEGKSCLKGMEYAACGIPCVASPTESYLNWVEDGKNGFLAGDENGFRVALEALLDGETRRRMGFEARQKAYRHRIKKHWNKWADLYGELRRSSVPLVPGQVSSSSAQKTPSGLSAVSAAI